MNAPNSGSGSDHACVHGHSDPEIDRPKRQARIIAPDTERFLRAVGAVLGRYVLQFPVERARNLDKTLLPEMERIGVTSAAEVGIETLAQRMTDEVIAPAGVVIGSFQIGAWARVPSS